MATKEVAKKKEVKAFARYVHTSPQKLRLVSNLVRKAPVDVALEQLRFSSKNAAVPLIKVINSAVANAVHNFNLNKEDLYIKTLTIDGGPVYKRYAPRAQGGAFVERKRTSHINVVLEAKEHGKRKTRRSIFSIRPKTAAEVEEEKNKKPIDEPEMGKVESTKTIPKQAPRSSQNVKQNLVSLKRRLFNRKSGS
jgi:large subunit ribosomal protein L22